MDFKILLVDDNQTFASSVKQFLAILHGATVVGHATSGLDALEQVRALKPDLVLLDIGLPDISGLDIARTLQTWPEPPKLIFLTMHNNQPYRDAAQKAGAAGFVNKANFVNQLFPIIEELVSKQPHQEGAV
jgi:DNA-binding NarL/FixJ family response regulator